MKQFSTLVFIILLSTHCLFSQVYIQIRVKQTHTKIAKLYYYQKTDLVLVDSAYKVSPEVFKFSLPAGNNQGLYKLTLGKNISFDFVVASEPQISLETTIFAAQDSLKSLVSIENDVYIKYCKIRKLYKQQLYLLNSLTDYYSDSSSFTKPLNAEIGKVNNDLYLAMKKLASDNPGLYSSNLILLEIKSNQINILSKKERQNNIKYWWSDANLNDARLVNSPLIDQKLWEFFELFFDDSYDKEQQDSSFIAAIKTVMNLKADSSIRLCFRNFLFQNLLETDYYEAIHFLYKTQFDGIQPLKLTPEEQIVYSSINSIKVGSKAADFKVSSSDGKNQKLSKITSPIKLVVFYSIYCPHCTEMMPKLLDVYHSYKDRGFEIIAISIDEEADVWRKYISDNKFTWINAIEYDNGNSKILPEYNITGTPELFLIDRNLTILSRPSNVKQLESKLKMILK
jgi:peroxiredoxin